MAQTYFGSTLRAGSGTLTDGRVVRRGNTVSQRLGAIQTGGMERRAQAKRSRG